MLSDTNYAQNYASIIRKALHASVADHIHLAHPNMDWFVA